MLRSILICLTVTLWVGACAAQPGYYGYNSDAYVEEYNRELSEKLPEPMIASGRQVANVQPLSREPLPTTRGDVMNAEALFEALALENEEDMRLHRQAAEQAFEISPSGRSVGWENTDSGNAGYVTPLNVTQNSTGEYCRQYVQSVIRGGKQTKADGTVCRMPEGAWRVIP